VARPAPRMTYWPAPRGTRSVTRSSTKRARATMEARKGRVKWLMSGRSRHPSSGAASFRPTSSTNTCGGGSATRCSARHKAVRTAVLSGAATCRLSMTLSLGFLCVLGRSHASSRVGLKLASVAADVIPRGARADENVHLDLDSRVTVHAAQCHAMHLAAVGAAQRG